MKLNALHELLYLMTNDDFQGMCRSSKNTKQNWGSVFWTSKFCIKWVPRTRNPALPLPYFQNDKAAEIRGRWRHKYVRERCQNGGFRGKGAEFRKKGDGVWASSRRFHLLGSPLQMSKKPVGLTPRGHFPHFETPF